MKGKIQARQICEPSIVKKHDRAFLLVGIKSYTSIHTVIAAAEREELAKRVSVPQS